MKKEIIREIISWVKMIFISVFIALVMNYLVLVNATVPTGSMENSIMVGDRIMAFRHSYAFSNPKRLDVIVFEYPDEPEDEIILYVKRIIGLPGETVDIIGGKVYINGSDIPLDEPYIKEDMIISADARYEVPENHYFVMGDNRNNSSDSRAWNNKYVSKDKIVGRLLFKYYRGFKLF